MFLKLSTTSSRISFEKNRNWIAAMERDAIGERAAEKRLASNRLITKKELRVLVAIDTAAHPILSFDNLVLIKD